MRSSLQHSHERSVRIERPCSRQAGEFGPTLRISDDAEHILMGEPHEVGPSQAGMWGLLRSKSGDLHRAAVRNQMRKSSSNLQIDDVSELGWMSAKAIAITDCRSVDDEAVGSNASRPGVDVVAVDSLLKEVDNDVKEDASYTNEETELKVKDYALALSKLEGTHFEPQDQDVDWRRLGQELSRSFSGHDLPHPASTTLDGQHGDYPAPVEQDSYAGDEIVSGLTANGADALADLEVAQNYSPAGSLPDNNSVTGHSLAEPPYPALNGYRRPMSVGSTIVGAPMVPLRNAARSIAHPLENSLTSSRYPPRTSFQRDRWIDEAGSLSTGMPVRGLRLSKSFADVRTFAPSRQPDKVGSRGKRSKDKHENDGVTETQGASAKVNASPLTRNWSRCVWLTMTPFSDPPLEAGLRWRNCKACSISVSRRLRVCHLSQRTRARARPRSPLQAVHCLALLPQLIDQRLHLARETRLPRQHLALLALFVHASRLDSLWSLRQSTLRSQLALLRLQGWPWRSWNSRRRCRTAQRRSVCSTLPR